MMNVFVLALAPVVYVLIGGVLVAIVITLLWFFQSVRGISFVPDQQRGMHLLVGQTATLTAALWRKRARSWIDIVGAGARTVTFRIVGGSGGHYTINGRTSAQVTSDNVGVAQVIIVAVTSGKAPTAANSPSAQPSRSYGPEEIIVTVYADEAAFQEARKQDAGLQLTLPDPQPSSNE